MPSRQVERDRARIIGHREFLEKERKRVKTAINAKAHADHALKAFLQSNRMLTDFYESDIILLDVTRAAFTSHVRLTP